MSNKSVGVDGAGQADQDGWKLDYAESMLAIVMLATGMSGWLIRDLIKGFHNGTNFFPIDGKSPVASRWQPSPPSNSPQRSTSPTPFQIPTFKELFTIYIPWTILFGLILLVEVPFLLLMLLGAALAFSLFVFTKLMFEIIAETRYLCWTGLSEGTLSEATPLLKPGTLPTAEPRKCIQPTGAYRAIDVDAVETKQLKDGVRTKELPTRVIQFPVDDITKTAILSWRWDFDKEQYSRNLASAIKYARGASIKFIFADIVSIDQGLPPVELAPRIKEFSLLFKMIPVIAAYDQARSRLGETMLRPWILSEMRLFLQNPSKVVCVSHNEQGSCVLGSAFYFLFGYPLRYKLGQTNFHKELRERCGTQFETSILHLLNGTITMAYTSDLKVILSPFADAFARADGLCGNDYLMTMLLLAKTARLSHGPPHFVLHAFTNMTFEKYRLSDRDVTPIWGLEKYRRRGVKRKPAITGYKMVSEVYIEDRLIARFRCTVVDYPPDPRKVDIEKIPASDYTIETVAGTEQAILGMLSLNEAERAAYVSRKAERRACLHIPGRHMGPKIDVVALRL